jgi:YYY domain-containing protein
VLTSGFTDLVVWLLILEVLGFCALPYLAWMLPNAVDRGYGVSKIFGVFCFGILSWLLPACGVIHASRVWVTVVFGVCLLAGYRGFSHCPVFRKELLGVIKKNALYVEGLFLGLSVIFALIRAANPEIFWGEKPMDSTFLHFFTRNEVLPPEDPWAAGHQMSYYYVGIYIVAALLKLSGIPVAIGYNVAIASLAGLIAAALYSLLGLITRSPIFSFLAAFFITFSSDPEVLNLCVLQRRPASFDTFWASTRVFTSPFFFEYTSWSMLFADLHAHVIAIPFTVLLLTLGVALFLDGSGRFSRHGMVLRFAAGATWGALYGINTWDAITFGLVLFTLLLFAPIAPFWQPPCSPSGRTPLYEKIFAFGFARSVSLVWDLANIAFGFLVVAVPYAVNSGAREQVSWGWATAPEFNSLGQLIGMLGYWLFGLLFAFALLIPLRLKDMTESIYSRVGSLASVGTTVACGIFLLGLFFFLPFINSLNGATNQPWALFSTVAFFSVSTWILLWRGSSTVEQKATGLFVVAGSFLIIVLEELFLIDRMNTLFKGYLAVWMLVGVGCCGAIFYAIREMYQRGYRASAVVFSLFPLLLVCLSFLGAGLNIVGVIRMQRVPTRDFTLDGAAYLWHSEPEDAAVIAWLNANITGTPTVLEAQGDSYREFTRIAMHSGLPTVLGWEHHVGQRGLPHVELLNRKQSIRQIYSTSDLSFAKNLLLQNRIDLIVVSSLERQTYPANGLTKFEENPNVFIPLYRSGGAAIYATYFSTYNPEYRGNLKP